MMEAHAGSSRKDRALATKARLYAAAEALFTRYGFDEVSVDRIVEEAGVAKGTFYVHFASKDDLLEALMSDYINKVDVNYQAFIDSFTPSTPAVDMLFGLVEKIMDVIEHTIGLERMSVLYRTQLTHISPVGYTLSSNRLLNTTVTDVLAKGVRLGEFSTELPLETLSNHLILAMRGVVYEWCVRSPDFDLQANAQSHFRILLKGLLR